MSTYGRTDRIRIFETLLIESLKVKDFDQVRDNLLDMLEDIDERLSKITNDTKSDDSVAVKNDEDSMLNEVSNIKRVISQIDSGTYGICLSCGKAIKKEYLTTQPFSNYCKHCNDEAKK